MTTDDLREALRDVTDPELGVSIVDLGLVYAISISGGTVRITMTMTSPACPLRDYIHTLVQEAVTSAFAGVQRVDVEIVDEPRWSEEMMSDAARRQLR